MVLLHQLPQSAVREALLLSVLLIRGVWKAKPDMSSHKDSEVIVVQDIEPPSKRISLDSIQGMLMSPRFG